MNIVLAALLKIEEEAISKLQFCKKIKNTYMIDWNDYTI